MTRTPGTYNPILDLIATALGVPVERFFDAKAVNPNEDAVALLQAWTAIGDTQGQRRVLSFAQREAERAAAGESPPEPNVVPFKPNSP